MQRTNIHQSFGTLISLSIYAYNIPTKTFITSLSCPHMKERAEPDSQVTESGIRTYLITPEKDKFMIPDFAVAQNTCFHKNITKFNGSRKRRTWHASAIHFSIVGTLPASIIYAWNLEVLPNAYTDVGYAHKVSVIFQTTRPIERVLLARPPAFKFPNTRYSTVFKTAKYKSNEKIILGGISVISISFVSNKPCHKNPVFFTAKITFQNCH